MDDQILISREDLPEFLNLLQEKIERKKQELKALEDRFGKYKNGTTPGVQVQVNTVPLSSVTYKANWTFVQKIDYFLKTGGKTTTEIVNSIIDHEPEKKAIRGKLVGTISAILSARSKAGGTYKKSANDRNINIYELNK